MTNIAMWSGPRNISTAMMYAFANRADCVAWDEPFYGAYLKATGLKHPMADEILSAMECDAGKVAASCVRPAAKPLFYQKHMTHHMLPAFGRRGSDGLANAFLIRAPEPTLASYAKRRAQFTLDEIGLPAQVALFERAADRLGRAPPVVDGAAVLARPAATLTALCAALGVPYTPEMLHWPSGPRASDGAWAPAWYDAVEKSTGFGPPRADARFEDLEDALKPIAEAARPLYERLARHKLAPLP